MKNRLEGRVAVVTGAARGLGKAIAEHLASEGANVALLDQMDLAETRTEIEAAGGRCATMMGDVSDPATVSQFAAAVHEELGSIDIVVNNAGFAWHCSFAELSYEDWRRIFAVNLDSMFLVTQALVDNLKRSRTGRVINLSPDSIWLNSPKFVHYVTTKAAIVGFTRSLANELGPDGVTVNAIAPGLVPTPNSTAIEPQEVFDKVIERQALKRQQKPRDLVGLAAFLASDDAAFITGQTIAVDGGLTRR